MTNKRFILLLRLSILLLLLAVVTEACGGTPSTAETGQNSGVIETPEATAAVVDTAAASRQIQVILANSQLVVGPNRFAVALLRPDGTMIHDADVHLTYFDLSDATTPVIEKEVDASRIQSPDGATTLFIDERDFERAGEWGLQVQARFPDGATALQRVGFQVEADSTAVIPGDQAPSIDTPTLEGHALNELTSATEPNAAFYEQSLMQALENGKPTLLYLATPAYCSSRLCGPGYEVFEALYQEWGDEVNFINVEVYTGLPDPAANGWELAPVMNAFGLATEPWLYFIDADGVVVHRIEGLFTADEVTSHLEALGS